jgi:ribosome-associated heat shock protein Hsp15
MAEQQRIDKWLWCARFFKTRTMAADAVKNGRVSLNGQRAKPSRNVQKDDQLKIEKPPFEQDIIVLGVAKQRQSAAHAGELYQESAESIALREDLATKIKASQVQEDTRFGKLTKKERRDRENFKRTF